MELLSCDDAVVRASDCSGGVWIVPWISRRERPDGVLRRVGRGLVCCIWVVDGRWRGIDGIAKGLKSSMCLGLHEFLEALGVTCVYKCGSEFLATHRASWRTKWHPDQPFLRASLTI